MKLNRMGISLTKLTTLWQESTFKMIMGRFDQKRWDKRFPTAEKLRQRQSTRTAVTVVKSSAIGAFQVFP